MSKEFRDVELHGLRLRMHLALRLRVLDAEALRHESSQCGFVTAGFIAEGIAQKEGKFNLGAMFSLLLTQIHDISVVGTDNLGL